MRAAVVALLAAVLVGCGGDTRPDPFAEVRDRTIQRPDRASPRWETITTLSASGSGRRRFTVADGAIQWRARYRCEAGRLRLTVSRRTLVEAGCPSNGEAVDIGTGPLTLRVRATGRWRVALDQQVDSALREPPLEAMGSPETEVVAKGGFYEIERRGRGTASLHRLPTGRLALRFEDFSTTANSDLFVWISTAPRPRTTVEAARAKHTVLRELKSTLGDQNYLLPRDVKAADVRSVIIWCVPVRIAYAAASLRR